MKLFKILKVNLILWSLVFSTQSMALTKMDNKVVKVFQNRMAKNLKGHLERVNKMNKTHRMPKSVLKEKHLLNQIFYFIWASNKWSLLGKTYKKEFRAIQNRCRDVQYGNTRLSGKSTSKNSKLKPFKISDFLSGNNYGCLPHTNKKGETLFAKYQPVIMHVLNLIRQNDAFQNSIIKTGNQISQDFINSRVESNSILNLFFPQAVANSTRVKVGCGFGAAFATLGLGILGIAVGIPFLLIVPALGEGVMSSIWSTIGPAGIYRDCKRRFK